MLAHFHGLILGDLTGLLVTKSWPDSLNREHWRRPIFQNYYIRSSFDSGPANWESRLGLGCHLRI